MSTSPIQPDDPRLTAYALGEGDEADRQAIEAFLTISAANRSEVEQTRAIARLLTAEYARQHELYLAASPEAGLPSNVVAFSTGRNRGLPRAFALSLKAAALLTVSASLVYLTVRATHRPAGATLASSAPTGSVLLATPPSLIADQPHLDLPVAPPDQDQIDSRQASAFGGSLPESATAPVASSSGNAARTAQAMEPADASGQIADTESRGQTSATLKKTEAAPPPATRDGRPSAAGAASAATVASSHPAKPLSPDERIARSVVRVRTAAGTFFGGVLVSTDGLVLAISAPPERSSKQPYSVLLADRRELPATAMDAESGSGWYRLRIDATNLPAVTLARGVPPKDAPLVVPSVDPSTGAITFPQVAMQENGLTRRAMRPSRERSPQTVGNAAFAFNTAGELLVIDRGTRGERAGSAAETTSDFQSPKEPFARPFTDAERGLLQPSAARNGQH